MSSEFDSGLFSNGQAAWHGFGNVFQEKIYDTQEAIKQAEMDWTVSLNPLFTKVDINGQPTSIELKDRKVVVRDDLKLPLGIVSERYVPLQNIEAFSFFDSILHEKECFISSAVSLSQGKKICVIVQVEDNIREVVKGDTVMSYLILATSHDGSMKTVVKFTNIRVVCMNTLVAALHGKGEARSVRHSKSQDKQLQEIKGTIDIYRSRFESEVDLYKKMANTPMNLEQSRSYLERLFEADLKSLAKKEDILLSEVKLEDLRITKKALQNLTGTPDLLVEGVAGTSWATFNAVTQAIKDKSTNQEKRYDSIWFGVDSALLDKAKYELLARV